MTSAVGFSTDSVALRLFCPQRRLSGTCIVNCAELHRSNRHGVPLSEGRDVSVATSTSRSHSSAPFQAPSVVTASDESPLHRAFGRVLARSVGRLATTRRLVGFWFERRWVRMNGILDTTSGIHEPPTIRGGVPVVPIGGIVRIPHTHPPSPSWYRSRNLNAPIPGSPTTSRPRLKARHCAPRASPILTSVSAVALGQRDRLGLLGGARLALHDEAHPCGVRRR